ncbi:LacI family DNA-binding transcriptional regulator [Nonomuraea thailandensis]
MPSRHRQVTLATIAAAAGVSVATVSKVLNGRSDVAPATRELVRELLVERGYVHRSALREPVATVELQVEGPCARTPTRSSRVRCRPRRNPARRSS